MTLESRLRGIVVFAAFVLAVYLATQTKLYYWDGISFAINIENARSAFDAQLFHPNHLVYDVLGRALYTLTHALGFQTRALTILQIVNSIFGALAAGLMAWLLWDIGGSSYAAFSLAGVFAFSATWWRFATDADSYVPAICFVIAAFISARKSRLISAGVFQALAMLLHQLSIFALPVLLLGAARKSGTRALIPAGISAAISAMAYILAFGVVFPGASLAGLWNWMTYASPDAHFTFDVARNLEWSITGTVKLFFGGRLSAAVHGIHHATFLVPMVFSATAAALLAFQVTRYGWPRLRRTSSWDVELGLLWMLPYAAFLFFWLPQNTFYRLFYLPPLIVICGALFSGNGGAGGSYRLLLTACAMALANLAFVIIPGMSVEANPPLQFALSLNQSWKPGTAIYYDTLTPDDWTLLYFNPKTNWIPLKDLTSPESIPNDAWIETTAYDRLQRTKPEWLSGRIRAQQTLIDADHRIIVSALR